MQDIKEHDACQVSKCRIAGLNFHFSRFKAIATAGIYYLFSGFRSIRINSIPEHRTSFSLDRFLLLIASLSPGQNQLRLVLCFPQREVHLQLIRLFPQSFNCFPHLLAHKSVATMSAIPLECSICPKSPAFSDLSHLLTHVASKGHLAHYLNTQLRAQKDENAQAKYEAFNRWYEKNQIQKLLSQRMSSKESRTRGSTQSKSDEHSYAPTTAPANPRRRQSKRTTIQQPIPSPVKSENIVDPRLTSNPIPAEGPRVLRNSPAQDSAVQHRAYVPRMLDWQPQTPRYQRRSSSVPPYTNSPPRHSRACGLPEDSENECFRAFIRTPLREAYPDPPHFALNSAQTVRSHTQDAVPKSDLQQGPASRKTAAAVLKGVRYPGMSLFDSASEEAQRQRNQKKDDAVVEQMENDSAAIEPLERIFWPEGTLKQKRLITGNVESSPFKDPSPQPKRPRARKPTQALADISTNARKVGKKRGRKPGKAKLAALEDVAERALETYPAAYPLEAQMDYHPMSHPGITARQNNASPPRKRKAQFDVFRDSDEDALQMMQAAANILARSDDHMSDSRSDEERGQSLHLSDGTEEKMLFHAANDEASNQTAYQLGLPVGQGQKRKRDLEAKATETEPDLYSREVAEREEGEEEEEPERIVQRYFVAVANQQPQFLDKMPPGMDFGGCYLPALYGASFNPLSTLFQRGATQQQYSQPVFQECDISASPMSTAVTHQFRASKSTSAIQETWVGNTQ